MFSPRRLRPVLALLAAGAVLSVPLPAAHAVVGTPAPDGTHAFTAHLDIGGTRSCSAALVDPEWLVTAASCFADDPQSGTAPAAGKPKLKTVATIGRTTLSGTGGHVAEVTQIVPRAGRDLVFARLASPATAVTPVKLAATAPAAGDALTVLGYGRTKTEWVPGKLHQANYTLDAVADGTLAMTGKSADDSVCKGDTGGPVLRATSGGSYELVAVNSRSWQGGCHGTTETRTGAIAARTDGKPGGASLTAGQTLASGDSLLSKSAKVTMGTDGNLTVASNAGKTLWSSGTSGNAGATATLSAAGNLSVKSAAGASLWESKTSAANGTLLLQDRGNLVVRTASGDTIWSSNTVVRNDLSGDGRSDFAVWYDNADGRDGIHRFTTAADGTFQTPGNGYMSTADTWNAANAKTVTGDYNGDGLADVAGVYGYSDGALAIWTWLAKADGTYATPFRTANVSGWTFTRLSFFSGDFDGDGRDDIGAWYDYAAGHDRLFTFRSAENGGFTAPTSSLTIEAGNWTADLAKLATGDYNGDGRDDLAAFYTYDSGVARIWSFLANADGGFNSGVKNWEAPSWGVRDRTTVYSGDFDGDGRDDLVAWYDYSDGSDGVHTWLADTGGLLSTHKASTRVAAGNLTRASMKIAAGDYNGDGRDDLGFLYGRGDGSVRMWTMPSLAGGTFGAYTGGWSGTTWTFARAGVIERYPS
ncbi:FG-GAP-like repeat-containing protein [Streptomyces sp. NBC_00287]|uniref:FG-GAP-like repeat-containing protein n=1 Tax=Streptomyces sp. NBC_00287 TaxID=2975702 RepID=UPI002E2BF442|nr:FG-GAP-like repeat-containing protein [Streptomyces sp. NBC_00287]